MATPRCRVVPMVALAGFFLFQGSPSLARTNDVNTKSAAESFIVFDPPGTDVVTAVSSISDNGDVVGTFSSPLGCGSSNPNPCMHGFVRDGQGNLVVFDAPNAYITRATSINNNGDTVGYFINYTGSSGGAFIRDKKGNFTLFNVPNSNSTTPVGINDAGTLAGNFYDTSTGTSRCFVLDKQGDLVVFDGPNPNATGVSSINNNGHIAGKTADDGFVRDQQGDFDVFPAPPPDATYRYYIYQVSSINANDNVAGTISKECSHCPIFWDGFIRDGQGNLTTFDVPNATNTFAYSINNRGSIAGTFYDPTLGIWRSYVRDKQGNFTVFDAPNASETDASSINNNGEVAGRYFDTMAGVWRAFIRTVH